MLHVAISNCNVFKMLHAFTPGVSKGTKRYKPCQYLEVANHERRYSSYVGCTEARLCECDCAGCTEE